MSARTRSCASPSDSQMQMPSLRESAARRVGGLPDAAGSRGPRQPGFLRFRRPGHRAWQDWDRGHNIPKLSSTPFATVSGNPHSQWGIGRQLLFGDNSSIRFNRIWGDCDHLVSPFILVHSTYRDRVREDRTLAEDLRNLVYRADTGRSG